MRLLRRNGIHVHPNALDFVTPNKLLQIHRDDDPSDFTTYF